MRGTFAPRASASRPAFSHVLLCSRRRTRSMLCGDALAAALFVCLDHLRDSVESAPEFLALGKIALLESRMQRELESHPDAVGVLCCATIYSRTLQPTDALYAMACMPRSLVPDVEDGPGAHVDYPTGVSAAFRDAAMEATAGLMRSALREAVVTPPPSAPQQAPTIGSFPLLLMQQLLGDSASGARWTTLPTGCTATAHLPRTCDRYFCAVRLFLAEQCRFVRLPENQHRRHGVCHSACCARRFLPGCRLPAFDGVASIESSYAIDTGGQCDRFVAAALQTTRQIHPARLFCSLACRTAWERDLRRAAGVVRLVPPAAKRSTSSGACARRDARQQLALLEDQAFERMERLCDRCRPVRARHDAHACLAAEQEPLSRAACSWHDVRVAHQMQARALNAAILLHRAVHSMLSEKAAVAPRRAPRPSRPLALSSPCPVGPLRPRLAPRCAGWLRRCDVPSARSRLAPQWPTASCCRAHSRTTACASPPRTAGAWRRSTSATLRIGCRARTHSPRRLLRRCCEHEPLASCRAAGFQHAEQTRSMHAGASTEKSNGLSI